MKQGGLVRKRCSPYRPKSSKEQRSRLLDASTLVAHSLLFATGKLNRHLAKVKSLSLPAWTLIHSRSGWHWIRAPPTADGPQAGWVGPWPEDWGRVAAVQGEAGGGHDQMCPDQVCMQRATTQHEFPRLVSLCATKCRLIPACPSWGSWFVQR